MFAFSTGLSALLANQVAIQTVSNNIANANTPGYHRQRVDLSDRIPIQRQNLLIGTGVQIDQIHRSFNSVLELSFSENRSQYHDVDQSLTVLRQVETILGPGNGSIHDRLDGFFNDLDALSLEPDNSQRRLISLRKLSSLTDEVQLINTRLNQIDHQLRHQIRNDISSVNDQFSQLIELNRRIKVQQNLGRQPNDLLDQFQQKINQLGELIDVQATAADDGGFAFQLAGGSFRFESSSLEFEAVDNADGSIEFHVSGIQTSIQFQSGSLAAAQRIVNSNLTDVQSRLAQFTNSFAFQLDHVHSTGLPLDGGFEVLNGARSVLPTDLPLIESSEFSQITAGSIFISVEQISSGTRELISIDFDPATDSVDDFVSRISSIPNLQAIENNGSVSIAAATDYRFDFAGRPETHPDRTNITGTAIPQISGFYQGSENSQFEFEIIGSGTVGVTDGLSVRVTENGALVGDFEIGRGYEPGSPIAIKDGIELQLDSGTFNAADQFSTELVAQADETGVLASLGLNSIFTGSLPADLSVRQDLLDEPSLFALSRNGNSADNSNLQRMLDLRESPTIGSSNFEGHVETINLDVAQEINLLNTEYSNLEIIGQQLSQQIDSLSGVDPNEEMVNLLKYQRSYEASIRVISTVDEVLAELFNLI